MKKNFKKMSAFLTAIIMTLGTLPMMTASASVVSVASDNFDDYLPVTLSVTTENNKGPMTAYDGNTSITAGDVVLAKDGRTPMWIANQSIDGKRFSGFGTSTAAIIHDPTNDEDEDDNVLAVEGRAEWTGYIATPTVYYGDAELSDGVEYIYNVDFYKTGNPDMANAGGSAVRFNVDGTTYYELFFAGWNGSYTTQLSRVINGTREILDANITKSENVGANRWYTLSIDVYEGNIKWSLLRQDTNTTIQTGQFNDSANALSAAGSKFELAARGQGGIYTLYDNFSISKNVILEDSGDFENLYETGVVNAESTDKELLGRWNIMASISGARAGWDDNTKFEIAQDPYEVNGNVLKIESRSAWNSPSTFPMVYNTLMTTTASQDYMYRFDFNRNGGNAGGGIRFNYFGEGGNASFYELYFAGLNSGTSDPAAFLSKQTNGVYETLPAEIASYKNGSFWTTPNRLVNGEWHHVLLKVFGNNISWEVQDSAGDIVQTGKYTETELQAAAEMKTVFFAAGQGNEYALFDNIYQNVMLKDKGNFEDFTVTTMNADKYADKTLAGNWMIKQATSGQNSGWDKAAKYAISDEKAALGKALKVESRAGWDVWTDFPMVYNPEWIKTESGKYVYNFKILRSAGNAGGGIRFNYSGFGNTASFYELYFVRDKGVQLAKCTEGVYEVLKADVSTNQGSDWTYWSGMNGLAPNEVFTVEIIVDGGEISWKVDHSQFWWQVGSYTDENPLSDLGTDTVFFAGGQGNEYIYFDDVSLKAIREDDGSLENVDLTGDVTVGKADARLSGEWFMRGTVNDERFGYDDKAKAGIKEKDGSHTLMVEAKSANTNYNQMPTVYNETWVTDSSEKNVYKFDMLKDDSRVTTAIRFNYSKTDDTHRSYYQLLFEGSQGSSNTKLKKLVNSTTPNMTTLSADIDRTGTMSYNKWYTVVLTVEGGNISWTVSDRSTDTIIETGSYVDEEPITGTDMMTMFGAVGQGSTFAYYDNLTLNAPEKIEEYAITALSDNTATIVAPETGDAIVIFAAYTDGQLTSVSYETVSLNAGENSINADSTFSSEGADAVKVMLWDGMTPLCPAF